MSGNMSFSTIRNSTLLNTTNATSLVTLMASSADLNASHPASSAVSANGNVNYQEADLWSFRIILSSLQELVFSNSPNSKIPPQLLKSIQNALISIKAEFDPKNPFLKSYNPDRLESSDIVNRNTVSVTGTTGADNHFDSLGQIGHGSVGGSIDLSNSIGALNLNSIPSEIRLLIRSMVSIQIRNMAKGIISMYAPLMDQAGVKISTANGGNLRDTNEPASEETEIQEALSGINSLLEKMKTDGQRLDGEIEDLKAERENEIQNYEHDINELQAIVTQLAEITVRENQSEKATCYLNYVKQANENLSLQQEILEIEQEVESNPPELVEELEEQYSKLKAAVDNLEQQNNKIKNRISEYEAIGPDYQDLLLEYRQLAEEIKTKEWVHEQLANGAWDKSLSESFF